MINRLIRPIACVAVVIVAGSCSDSPSTPVTPTPPPPPGPQSATVLAVGDIGECGSPGVAQTARLVEGLAGELLLAGDLAYPVGTMSNFVQCFDPEWGSNRPRWRPVPGNHEYMTPNAAGYFQYFGQVAANGQYAFRAGPWQVLMLDSNVPVNRGSPQYAFAQSELAAHQSRCSIAVWHHPLFSSGPNGNNPMMREMWQLLQQSGVDVVVSGHDHLYERFGKQDVDGRSDAGGIRQFIVGTGGAHLYEFARAAPNSQFRLSAHGVLRLTLNRDDYAWAFLDISGATADSGSDTCH